MLYFGGKHTLIYRMFYQLLETYLDDSSSYFYSSVFHTSSYLFREQNEAVFLVTL